MGSGPAGPHSSSGGAGGLGGGELGGSGLEGGGAGDGGEAPVRICEHRAAVL